MIIVPYVMASLSSILYLMVSGGPEDSIKRFDVAIMLGLFIVAAIGHAALS